MFYLNLHFSNYFYYFMSLNLFFRRYSLSGAAEPSQLLDVFRKAMS